MPSPFPGVDPYIESSGRWGDFHGSLAAAMRAALNDRLPSRYFAEIDLYVLIEDRGPQRKQVEPDVYVADSDEKEPAKRSPAGSVIAAPATVVLPAVARRRRKRVQIVDQEANRVVTAIEVLSPSNKAAGDDRQAYLRKRSEYVTNGVSLVEMDFLRAGRRLPLRERPTDDGEFYVLVCRSWEYPRAGLWAFGLRSPYPDVPIPLAPDVPDVVLPLQTCADRAYDEGRYDRLPYDRPLTPRPRKQDAAWLAGIIAGRRPK